MDIARIKRLRGLGQGVRADREAEDKMNYATITFYSCNEDVFGSAIAFPNLDGQFKATVGFTIAVDPRFIPYGTLVNIPDLAGFSKSGDGIFRAEDTGSDVVKRVASLKRGNVFQVFDVYAGDVDQARLSELTAKYGPTAEYAIVT